MFSSIHSTSLIPVKSVLNYPKFFQHINICQSLTKNRSLSPLTAKCQNEIFLPTFPRYTSCSRTRRPLTMQFLLRNRGFLSSRYLCRIYHRARNPRLHSRLGVLHQGKSLGITSRLQHQILDSHGNGRPKICSSIREHFHQITV